MIIHRRSAHSEAVTGESPPNLRLDASGGPRSSRQYAPRIVRGRTPSLAVDADELMTSAGADKSDTSRPDRPSQKR